MKFKSFYNNRPAPVGTKLDLETKFVDQSEADRSSLSYQLERFGMDSLLQKLEQTRAQFGYADTRMTKDFVTMAENMAEANSYFMQLPAKIRKEFGHDPVQFYNRIETDPKYMYEKGYISEKLAIDLGVVKLQDNNKIDVTTPVVNNFNVTDNVDTTVQNENVSA